MPSRKLSTRFNPMFHRFEHSSNTDPTRKFQYYVPGERILNSIKKIKTTGEEDPIKNKIIQEKIRKRREWINKRINAHSNKSNRKAAINQIERALRGMTLENPQSRTKKPSSNFNTHYLSNSIQDNLYELKAGSSETISEFAVINYINSFIEKMKRHDNFEKMFKGIEADTIEDLIEPYKEFIIVAQQKEILEEELAQKYLAMLDIILDSEQRYKALDEKHEKTFNSPEIKKITNHFLREMSRSEGDKNKLIDYLGYLKENHANNFNEFINDYLSLKLDPKNSETKVKEFDPQILLTLFLENRSFANTVKKSKLSSQAAINEFQRIYNDPNHTNSGDKDTDGEISPANAVSHGLRQSLNKLVQVFDYTDSDTFTKDYLLLIDSGFDEAAKTILQNMFKKLNDTSQLRSFGNNLPKTLDDLLGLYGFSVENKFFEEGGIEPPVHFPIFKIYENIINEKYDEAFTEWANLLRNSRYPPFIQNLLFQYNLDQYFDQLNNNPLKEDFINAFKKSVLDTSTNVHNLKSLSAMLIKGVESNFIEQGECQVFKEKYNAYDLVSAFLELSKENYENQSFLNTISKIVDTPLLDKFMTELSKKDLDPVTLTKISESMQLINDQYSAEIEKKAFEKDIFIRLMNNI